MLWVCLQFDIDYHWQYRNTPFYSLGSQHIVLIALVPVVFYNVISAHCSGKPHYAHSRLPNSENEIKEGSIKPALVDKTIAKCVVNVVYAKPEREYPRSSCRSICVMVMVLVKVLLSCKTAIS